VRLDALRRSVGAVEQFPDDGDLLGVVLRFGVRLLEQFPVEAEPRRGQQPLDRERGRYQQPVPGDPGRRGPGARRGAVRRWFPARSGGPAEPEVDAAGMQRVEQPELLDRRQGRAMPELDRARAQADALGRRRDQGDQQRGGGSGDARVEVMLGEPVPGVAGLLGLAGEVDAVAQRLRRRLYRYFVL
jgi:hypothetical protein